MLQSNNIITTESKIKITLKETAKVKKVKMISVDSKEVDNVSNNIEVVNIDKVNKTIVENEVMIDAEEAISINNKEEIEIKTNIEKVSNVNIKSRPAKIVDREDTIMLLKLKKCLSQNTDKLSCLSDSINITQLHDITVNAD